MFHLSENCTCGVCASKRDSVFYLEYQKDVHEKGNCPPLNRCELDGSSYPRNRFTVPGQKYGLFVCLLQAENDLQSRCHALSFDTKLERVNANNDGGEIPCMFILLKLSYFCVKNFFSSLLARATRQPLCFC